MIKVLNVNLRGIEVVKKFADINLTSTDCSVTIASGRYIIDGKSIMGIFSLDLTKPVSIEIDGEAEDIADLLSKYKGIGVVEI